MKVAIFSDNFYPEMSGISDSIILIAKGLAERGHQINFYVPRYSRKNYAISKLKPEELDLGKNIKIVRLFSLPYPFTPARQGRLVLPFLFSLRHIKKFNPDIIYTQDYYGAGLEALFVSKLLGKTLIGTNHTPIAEFLRYSPIRAEWLKRLILKYISWYYNQCLWITAPSRSILEEMKKYGFKKESQPLSNPIDLAGFNPVGHEIKKELKRKFNLSAKTVIYTGRLGIEKNVDVIIRAIALVREKMPDITLAVTGHGNAELKLKELSKKLGLEKNIFFFGYVEPEKFTRLYQASDIFAVMSTAETQCMSMMQAMAAGLPVIGANAWGLPEYINAGNGYVLEPGDVKGLAEKIIYLFSHPDEIAKLGKGGYEYVKNFSAGKIIDKWEELFHSAVSKRLKNLKISFVIPAHNEECYLGKCLESVLRETEKVPYETEIIVVNNASTDRTKKIALAYPGIQVVDEPRKGLTKARQAGFLASRHALIANIDADVILSPGWIDKAIKEFSKNENLVALSGPYIYYDRSWGINFLVWLYYFPGFLLHLFNHHILRTGAMLQGGNFILKRSALEKIGGFDIKIDFYGEDTDIAKRIQKTGRVKFSFLLPMRTSGRRFSGEGLITTAAKYVVNHFWVLFFKKPFSKEYQDIR